MKTMVLRQESRSWTLHRLGATKPSCIVQRADIDPCGQQLAFSTYCTLPNDPRDDVVRLTSISWYSIVDIGGRRLLLTGPHSPTVEQRVQDEVVGWSPDGLLLKRTRLTHAGTKMKKPDDPVEYAKLAGAEVSLLLVSHEGREQTLRSYVVHDPIGGLPPDFLLSNFTLCPTGDCVLFTEFKPVFRNHSRALSHGIQSVVVDETASKHVVHRVDVRSGHEQTLAEITGAWRCQSIYYDCKRRVIRAIASIRKGTNAYLGMLQSGSSSEKTLKTVRLEENAAWGSLSPDGKMIAFVNGDGASDVSKVRVLRWDGSPQLAREVSVPGWRRKVTWSRDSGRMVLWYSVWFHDEKGRKFQRLYEGFRFWVADASGTDVRPIGPLWSGFLEITWDRQNRGIYVIANGVLGYLDISTGRVERLCEVPTDWNQIRE